MKLCDVLKDLRLLDLRAPEELDITGITYDSRRVKSGDLFVAVRGYTSDGHAFIPMAAEKGCAAVLCEEPPEADIPADWKTAHDEAARVLEAVL